MTWISRFRLYESKVVGLTPRASLGSQLWRVHSRLLSGRGAIQARVEIRDEVGASSLVLSARAQAATPLLPAPACVIEPKHSGRVVYTSAFQRCGANDPKPELRSFC